MGGHGHGHDAVKIPSPDSYKVENNEILKQYQERLAKEGLKDPWIRNEVWRYHPNMKTTRQRAAMLLRGWKLGVPAFLLTIGYDYLMSQGKDKDHHDGGHH